MNRTVTTSFTFCVTKDTVKGIRVMSLGGLIGLNLLKT